MQTEMKKAAAGHRQSMEQLYNWTKERVYDLAYAIVLDAKKANAAVVFVYENLWRDGNLSRISTMEELVSYLDRKVAKYCKNILLKENKKAFNVPQQKNFYIGGLTKTQRRQGNVVEEVLWQFSVQQRFIFVLHTLTDCSEEEIAKMVNWKTQVIQLALEAEERNIEKICNLQKKNDVTVQEWIQIFKDNIGGNEPYEQTDKKIYADIDSIAAPIEKKKKQRITLTSVLTVLILACTGVVACYMTKSLKESEKTNSEKQEAEAEIEVESSEEESDVIGEVKYADIEIEGYGTITVELDETAAPETVTNFVTLAEEGFYDGLTFHRIIEDFMMQGGDPNGDGTGGSDETITGEFSENGFENNLSHTRGAISMARSDDYDSASSQFFIVHQDSTHLDDSYAVFGYVTEGMDIVDEICTSANPTDDNGSIASEEQPVITSITIRREES